MHKTSMLLSSLEKVFFDLPDNLSEYTSGSMFKNEIYSFQLAFAAECEDKRAQECRLEIVSDIKEYITAYCIDYVPARLAAYPFTRDDNYISKAPGLYPDVMNKIYDGNFRQINGQACSIWFAIEPDGMISGTYPIGIKIYDEDGALLADKVFTIKIIDKELPKQTLINTCWFHGDCIGVHHGAEINSDKYFEIIEKFLRIYAKFGHNMILTPIFTPPLDTDIGAERPTNQLVDVYMTKEGYSFGFDKLDFWIDLCQKYGIEYFEISHLFTQWGAEYTPKIVARTECGEKRIFGWDVEALSDEYKMFIDAFMPRLVEFLKNKGVLDRCFFHVSDEPTKKHVEQYRVARDMLLPYVPEERLIDALSDYEFYEFGLVKKPIVCNDHIKTFIKKGVKNLWTYYCCAQGEKVANRFMAMPSARNRILGFQLYKNDIEGFLQWGFNFWFSERSREVINPYATTDADGAFPSGDPFVVYPLNKNGDVVTSLRLYVFYEALQDMRALQLLEEYKGKEYVDSILSDINGFEVYPKEPKYILNLRERINKEIEEA